MDANTKDIYIYNNVIYYDKEEVAAYMRMGLTKEEAINESLERYGIKIVPRV